MTKEETIKQIEQIFLNCDEITYTWCIHNCETCQTIRIAKFIEQEQINLAKQIFDEIKVLLVLNEFTHIPFNSFDEVPYYSHSLGARIMDLENKYLKGDPNET